MELALGEAKARDGNKDVGVIKEEAMGGWRAKCELKTLRTPGHLHFGVRGGNETGK